MGTGDVDTLKILQNIGLSESKAKETVKNNALTQFLLQVIAEVIFPVSSRMFLIRKNEIFI